MVDYHNAHDQLEVVRNWGAQNQLWKRATGLLSFLADEPGTESASCVQFLAPVLNVTAFVTPYLHGFHEVPHTGVDVIIGKRDEPA